MADLVDYKQKIKSRKYVQDFPLGILDVIETDFPTRYLLMFEDQTPMTSLFSTEEWIDILTKSRNSCGSHIQRLNSCRKYSAQGN